MDTNKLTNAIMTAAKKTFEDMVFVDISTDMETDVQILPDLPDQILSISFYEPDSGEIVLFLSSGCARMIVENIYGKEWESLDKQETKDCLLELLNVLAGNFLSYFYEDSHHHATTFPKFLPGFPDITESENHNIFYFNAEGERFKVYLNI